MSSARFLVTDLEELADVRRAMTAELVAEGVGEQHRHDAVLATTELLSNALLHGGGSATVQTDLTADGIRVGVADAGPGSPDVPHLDPHRIGGNGLRLVEAVATAWGFAPRPDGGKEVWFRIAW